MIFNQKKSKERARNRRKITEKKVLTLERPEIVAGVGEMPVQPTKESKREFVEWTEIQVNPKVAPIRIHGDISDVSPGVMPWKQIWPQQ